MTGVRVSRCEMSPHPGQECTASAARSHITSTVDMWVWRCSMWSIRTMEYPQHTGWFMEPPRVSSYISSSSCCCWHSGQTKVPASWPTRQSEYRMIMFVWQNIILCIIWFDDRSFFHMLYLWLSIPGWLSWHTNYVWLGVTSGLFIFVWSNCLCSTVAMSLFLITIPTRSTYIHMF